MTGRQALMAAAVLQVVRLPIRYTTKKLICTIIAAEQSGKFLYQSPFYFHQPMHCIFAQQYIKIYVKIHIKIAPTCFGLTTIRREHFIDLS
jgi:hypothetical protein